jgi:hypothetical protein
MAAIDAFDAKTWIAGHVPGGGGLSDATYATVSSFTMLWNYFEQTRCNNGAGPEVLRGLADSIDAQSALPDALLEALAYWTDRYVEGGDTNSLFDGLNFRPKDDRAMVEAAVKGQTNSPRDVFLALLTIVYRLRNNLFHGLKTIEMLNDQRQNLAMACQALAGAILLLN